MVQVRGPGCGDWGLGVGHGGVVKQRDHAQTRGPAPLWLVLYTQERDVGRWQQQEGLRVHVALVCVLGAIA